MRVDLEGEIVNIMSAYAPQMGCDEEEKTQFWEDVEEDLREILESERLWIGGDFNGHCGSNNRGKEDTIGIYGVGASNVAGDQLVDFAMNHSLQGDLGSITPRRKLIGVQRTKWWKLADKDTQSQFVVAARDKLQQSEREGNRSFEEVTEDLRKLGERLLGRTSRKCKPGKETWWWNDEVQESLKRKKEAEKTLDMENDDENKEVYKLAKKEAKKSVARAKARAYQVVYEDMETIDGQKRALRMAKQRDKNSKDINQTRMIKDEKGNVLVENAEILKRWQGYFNKLMNEENPRESRQETQRVVEKRT
ncbi:uncharacterized protein [Penaeus vannamei]|uniref:uncharacterized protein n=1 Tax=Penaeus vannamei TaxID=6689 RepID=UPI00387F813A